MNVKKVEIIHTKPRGKGQCSPEQTCPEVPLVLYRFLILIFVFVDKVAEKNINNPISFSCLYILVFIYFVCFLHFYEVGKCNHFDLLRYWEKM